MSNYIYKTIVRDGSQPTYKFAEVKYGKIVALHEHWVPLKEFRNFFEAGALFLDITGIKIEGEDPVIGDTVNSGENGYEIVHFKSIHSVAETKNYKTELLKLQRNVKELEPIEWNGILYDADKDSLTRLDKARRQLEDEKLESKLWTAADNSKVLLTLDDFIGINCALSNRATLLHARYNELKSYIENIDGEKYLAVILAIDWDWDINCNLETKLIELTGHGSDTGFINAIISEENVVDTDFDAIEKVEGLAE